LSGVRFLARLTWLAFFVAVAARADVRETESHFALYLPEASWKISFVRDAWQLQTNNTRPDVPLYHLFSNRPKLLTFSIFVDTTTKCSSGASCRERFWRDAANSPGLGTITDSKMFERNGFHVVQFSTEYPQSGPRTTQVSAHAYRDGSWIDVRVSKTGSQTPDAAPLLAFLDTFAIGAKEFSDLPVSSVRYDIGDGVKLVLPAGWYFSNRPLKAQGDNEVLVLSRDVEMGLSYVPLLKPVPDDALDKIFAGVSAGSVPLSKEKAIHAQPIASESLRGLYATYTSDGEPGFRVLTRKKHRHMTDIYLTEGRRAFLIAIGSSSLDGADYTALLDAIRKIRLPERQAKE